jgi:anthranilate synthase component 1
VSAELRPGVTSAALLRATFPGGSITGAPKIRAMQIIDELEETRRGPYAGAVGYFDFSGNLDTCIALRTAFITRGTAYVQAGAGIVADSDPEYEERECRNKARALLSAVAAAGELSG